MMVKRGNPIIIISKRNKGFHAKHINTNMMYMNMPLVMMVIMRAKEVWKK